MNESQLKKEIQMYDFALQEAILYLNSHPKDKQAMMYYKKFQHLYQQAVEEYERCFTPLTNRTNDSDDWQYINGPWPWESGV
ncbi:spore coat protein CotJB [[Eubacterium] hominis]|uniref:spore coat protein CotJB n=1 Tax=[Eubacterium] hominis TaxID=2764325 RepID=UPI003A4DF389